MSTLQSLIITCALLIPMGMLVGCTQPLNDRMTLGGSYLSPTFRTPSPTKPAQASNIHLLNTTPMPRSAWRTTRYIAPFDGVVHGHTLTLGAPIKNTAKPRHYGRFPTINDAMLGQSPSWFHELFANFQELGRSTIGSDYACLMLTISGELFEPTVSPRLIWKRTNTTNTWSSGFPALSELDLEPNDEE